MRPLLLVFLAWGEGSALKLFFLALFKALVGPLTPEGLANVVASVLLGLLSLALQYGFRNRARLWRAARELAASALARYVARRAAAIAPPSLPLPAPEAPAVPDGLGTLSR